MRIAATADLHCGVNDRDRIRERLGSVNGEADVLVLAGDLTNFGQPAELDVLISQLLRVRIPIISVLGNHDFESGQHQELLRMLREVGIKTLDGEPYVRDGVGFAGVKGFCGGFDRHELTAFGEPEIKAFVQAGVQESLHLERALSLLQTEKRVVVLHYAPICDTITGEPKEIAPFLGNSRLSDVCDRFEATVVFHGHAHHGKPVGKTRGGVPVYNVAQPVLLQEKPGQFYRVVDI